MPRPGGFYSAFVRTCGKYPARVAVRHFEENRYKLYTYSELYGVCEHISKTLQQLQCQKTIIGLITGRNVIVPCIIAAAHKSNMSFMFLDNNEDIVYQTKGLCVTLIVEIIKEENNIIKSPLKEPYKFLNVLGYQIRFYNYSLQNDPDLLIEMHGCSFIMLSSGSTGEPKQIEVPTSCIQPNIDDLSKLFMVQADDVIYFSTPLTFDPSMIEIQLAIANGASLLIAPNNPHIILSENNENSITVWQTTPSNFFSHPEEVIRKQILSARTTLRILALGGEPLMGVYRLTKLKHSINKTKIFTLYGVTEMSCWACAAELDFDNIRVDQDVPLGQCLSETDIVIKHKAYSKTGEILLVSSTRKCEILNRRKDVSETKSLQNYVDTGDLGEKKNDKIYFRGRKDDIIKRFGHKINLQTIENTIMLCPNVDCCSCIWLPKPHLVVVYFTSQVLSSRELSDYLRCKLDERHWPDKVIRVDNLPTNSHGKISKSMLMKRFRSSSNETVTIHSLKSLLLEELKSLFESNFTYDDIKDKDIFTLGGTSFVAVTLCNRLSQQHEQFGKFLLPYIVTPENTIEEIMEKVEASLIMDENKSQAKRFKKSALTKPTTSCTETSVLSVTNKTMTFELVWSYNTEKCVDSSPTLLKCAHNDYIVVGSHSGMIVVYDALYRALIGVAKINSRIEASFVCYRDMPMDVPCGVVGAYDGTVVCVKLENAKIKWLKKIGSMVKSTGVKAYNSVYIAAYDGAVHIFHMKTGTIKGKIQISEQPISADLVITRDQYVIVATLSGFIAAIDATNECITWRGKVSSPIFAKPVLFSDDKFVVIAEVNGDIHCRTADAGITLWKFQAEGNLFSSMCVLQLDTAKWQLVFGCHDSNVYSIIVMGSSVPSLQWKTPVGAPVYSTPCGLNKQYILAAAKTGNLYVLDATSGEIVAVHQLPYETFSSPYIYKDIVFIGCRDDHIYGLKLVSNS